MKKFDDFLETLTQEEIIAICDSCNDNAENVRGLGNKIGNHIFLINLALLRRYHEWVYSSEADA